MHDSRFEPLPILGDFCEVCGKTTPCTDTRNVDGEELVVCRDCAMQCDDGTIR